MAYPSKFVTRRELGWGPTPAGRATTNLGMIAHYNGGRTNLASKTHSACVSYWKNCRTQHIRGNGWLDVGYAYFVCPHGYIFEGRTVNHVQAAEAPTAGKLQGGNTRYVAVTFAGGEGERPTKDQIDAWHRLRDWLQKNYGVRDAVHGHRDFTHTSCPGSILYAMTNDGTLSRKPKGSAQPKPKPTTPEDQEKEEVLQYASFGASTVGKTECQPGEWTDVLFDTEYADPTKVHPDEGANPSILKGKPSLYTLEFGADVEDATVGDVMDVDVAEYVYDKSVSPPVDRLKEQGKATSAALTESFRVHHAAVGNLRKNGKLRVRVRSHAAGPVKIANARVSVCFVE